MRARSFLPLAATLAALLLGCEPGPAPGPETTSPAPTATSDGAKPMLPVFETEAEKVHGGKDDGYAAWRLARPDVYNITAAPKVAFTHPAEFEPHAGLLLAWTGSFPDTYAAIVKHAQPVAPVVVVHDGASARASFQKTLASRGVAETNVVYADMPVDSIWIRDFGPLTLRSAGGALAFADLRYYHQRQLDDAVPWELAQRWGVNDYRVPVKFEGGNFMTDGRGTCFASQGILWYNSASEAQLRAIFRDWLGCEQLVIMQPLVDEGTTHIDMFSKLTDDHTVIVGAYEATQDSGNRKVLDDNAKLLASVVLADGKPLKVARMPMPSNSGRQIWRTYVNSQFVNGVNLVPVYSVDKAREAAAMKVWQQVMPAWKHVAVPADGVIEWNGAIHCISMQVPQGTFEPIEAPPAQICATYDCYPAASTATAGCGSVTWEGECQGSTLVWCENKTVKKAACGQSGKTCGWNAAQEYYDCLTGGPACAPSCGGKQCGDDGCGGSCGSCGAGATCSKTGACVAACTPDCGGKQCGDDGCGGSCGACGAGQQCTSGGTCVGGAAGCAGLTYEGCCDGKVLLWCEGGAVQSLTCGGVGCGWSQPKGFYDCNAQGAGPAQFPIACP